MSAATASVTLTGAPTILGTLPYMAPEQLEGNEADARADLWAFGAVLYEMLTGQRAFDGESEAQIIGAVVERDPELLTSAQLPATPPELDRLVRACLAKKPDDRWATAHDVVVQLRGIGDHVREGHAASARRSSPARKRVVGSGRGRRVAGDRRDGAAVASALAPVDDERGGKPSIAVLYFENNTGNASLDWLRTGLTDMVVTDLSQSPDVEVLGTDRLYQILRDLHRADDRVVSFDTVQEIARRAGVQTVVLGSYVKAGDAIRINIKVQEAVERPDPRRRARRGRQRSATLSRCRRSHTEDSSKVCAAFELGIGCRRRPASPAAAIDRDLAEVTTSSIEAYRYYADGVGLHERGRDVEAIVQLRRAVALDPGFAMALAKLAIAELQSAIDPDRAWRR